MKYISNAFSLQMVEGNCNLKVEEIPQPSAEELDTLQSCIGHADTAQVLGIA